MQNKQLLAAYHYSTKIIILTLQICQKKKKQHILNFQYAVLLSDYDTTKL